ncbi:DUF5134 domain-containing protein [Actinokineospora auranticolor]|uniref:Uncharacterized protein DUF5134 n=1 Tax=Actinokineospora auranticolor TaxID=155976 RepID=A0A2S6GGX5_9PSEU|nr:DUF5134 domain-containing protein [Actinokineospora auranticolor]PPK64477.1 uncharacterized protein DUF5134 [Actinokineospora auranticolor]
MAVPTWLGWVLTAAFLGIAGYSAARLVAANRRSDYTGRERAVDLAHALMALGMAVMCSPIGGPLPPAGWQAVFALVTAWFLGAALLGGRGGASWHGGDWQHAVAGLAMLYMLTAGSHTAHAMSSAWFEPHFEPHGNEVALPLLGWLFVAFFAFQALWLGRALVAGRTADQGILADRRVAAVCQLVMALGTGYLILVML